MLLPLLISPLPNFSSESGKIRREARKPPFPSPRCSLIDSFSSDELNTCFAVSLAQNQLCGRFVVFVFYFWCLFSFFLAGCFVFQVNSAELRASAVFLTSVFFLQRAVNARRSHTVFQSRRTVTPFRIVCFSRTHTALSQENVNATMLYFLY